MAFQLAYILRSPASDMRKQARRQLRDTRDLLRRGGERVPKKVRDEVAECAAGVEESLRAGPSDAPQVAALAKQAERLGGLTSKHLSTFRKPAWRESFESIAIAIVVALILRAFVVEAFKIPSGSMIPTLAIGDQIFVNKLVYGIRIPFTSIRVVDFALPQRGDVIVFICPVPPNEDYIKRVVGLPGDEIVVRAGTVYVNGNVLPREPIGRTSEWDRDSEGDRWSTFEAYAYRESVGDKSYTVLDDANPLRRAGDFGPYTVPDGHVFVMGDNRDHSFDSRSWGPVPLQNILGHSMFVWWSWGHKKPDWQRLFTWVD